MPVEDYAKKVFQFKEGGIMSLLSTAQVAEITGLSQGTLRYFRATDQGPRYGKLGRRCMYRSEDVEAWIDEQFEATARGGEPKEAA